MDRENRYATNVGIIAADGWCVERLTSPSRLFGANGLRAGPDGRLFVAQVAGSSISAVDISSGGIESISAKGGDIVAPDDVAFDEAGNLFATEITEGRVSMRSPDGKTRVLNGAMPCANPITVYQDRIFAGEFRPDGRIMELDRNGGAPRVIAQGLPMPNAMEVGPDGKLYVPIMGLGEIWQIDLSDGRTRRVVGDLKHPTAVKFDASGRIVATMAETGEVLRIEPETGRSTFLASMAKGLDNLAFVSGRLFVSVLSGQINEVRRDGTVSELLPMGFNWPLGIALKGADELYVADGPYLYSLRPGGKPEIAGQMFEKGFPRYIRGISTINCDEVMVTTGSGSVARYWPYEARSEELAVGLDQPIGLTALSSTKAVVVEYGAGRVVGIEGGVIEEIASGLDRPIDVAAGPNGDYYVTESGAGRVIRISGGRSETILSGMSCPHGIAVSDGKLYVADPGRGQLIEFEISSNRMAVLASHLPIGPPPGVVPHKLRSIGDLLQPTGPFTGLAIGAGGRLYIAGDSEGSILSIRPR